MSEKRFTIKEIDNFSYGIKVTDVIIDDGIELPQSTVCDLLNQLSDENEQLKMENNELKLLVQNWEALDEEKDEQLDKQNQALKKLKKENEQLKKLLECSREEANDYCEELMGKDEFIRLYKSQRDDTIKENEQLKQEKDVLINKIDLLEQIIDGDL